MTLTAPPSLGVSVCFAAELGAIRFPVLCGELRMFLLHLTLLLLQNCRVQLKIPFIPPFNEPSWVGFFIFRISVYELPEDAQPVQNVKAAAEGS